MMNVSAYTGLEPPKSVPSHVLATVRAKVLASFGGTVFALSNTTGYVSAVFNKFGESVAVVIPPAATFQAYLNGIYYSVWYSDSNSNVSQIGNAHQG